MGNIPEWALLHQRDPRYADGGLKILDETLNRLVLSLRGTGEVRPVRQCGQRPRQEEEEEEEAQDDLHLLPAGGAGEGL